jgi:hypothetical protein
VVRLGGIFIVALAVACGDSSSGEVEGTAGYGSGGNSAAGAQTGGTVSLPVSPSTVLSGVTFTSQRDTIRSFETGKGYTIDDGENWLRIVASAYYVHDPNSGEAGYNSVWLARVENVGPSLVCFAQINPTFFDSEGEQLLASITVGDVHAPNFFVPHGSASCIEPGKHGIAVGNDSLAVLDVSRVAEIRYRGYGTTYVDPTAPNDRISLSDVMQNDDAVRGTLTNVSPHPLEWWSVFAFGYDGSGSIAAAQFLTDDADEFPAGHVWSFETERFSLPISGHEVFYRMGYN